MPSHIEPVPQPDELNQLSYIERIDVEDRVHQHELERARLRETEETKRARLRVREARQPVYMGIGIAVCVVALLLGLAYIWWGGPDSPPRPDQDKLMEQQREATCVKNHGVWINKEMLVDGVSVCLYPGTPADQQVPKK